MAKALVDLQRTQVVGADLTTSWHVPAGAEYGSIMTSISKSSSGDNARRDARSKWIVDPWGKPFLIAMRKSEAGEFEYIVWSRGADGVSGTSDDVIFPRGRELPQGLVLPE
jgi:hypothetical protein